MPLEKFTPNDESVKRVEAALVRSILTKAEEIGLELPKSHEEYTRALTTVDPSSLDIENTLGPNTKALKNRRNLLSERIDVDEDEAPNIAVAAGVLKHIDNLSDIYREVPDWDVSLERKLATQGSQLAVVLSDLLQVPGVVGNIVSSSKLSSTSILPAPRLVLDAIEAYALIEISKTGKEIPFERQEMLKIVSESLGANEYSALINEIASNGEEELIREKSAKFAEPNPHLRMTVELVAYNELEVSAEGTQRGNIADYLRDFVAAAENYDNTETQKGNTNAVSEIELLVNVNNKRGEFVERAGRKVSGTEANRRTLELFEFINSSDDIEAINQVLPWLNNPNDSDFYKDIVGRARALKEKGLQFNVVDCTDGSFISHTPGRDDLEYQSSQAARRRILSSISEMRFAGLQNEGNKAHIFADADSRLREDYFTTIRQELDRDPNDSAVCLYVPFVTMPESKGGELSFEQSKYFQLLFSLRDFYSFSASLYSRLETETNESSGALSRIARTRVVQRLFTMFDKYVTKEIDNAKYKYYPTPSPFTMVLTSAAYNLSQGWDIYVQGIDGGGEDSNLQVAVRKTNAITRYVPKPVVAVQHRVRDESWAGRTSNWKEVTWADFTGPMRTAVNHMRLELREKYQEDLMFNEYTRINVEEFGFALVSYFNKIQEKLTQREKELLTRCGIDKFEPISSEEYYYTKEVSPNDVAWRMQKDALLALMNLTYNTNRAHYLSVDLPNISFVLSAFARARSTMREKVVSIQGIEDRMEVVDLN